MRRERSRSLTRQVTSDARTQHPWVAEEPQDPRRTRSSPWRAHHRVGRGDITLSCQWLISHLLLYMIPPRVEHIDAKTREIYGAADRLKWHGDKIVRQLPTLYFRLVFGRANITTKDKYLPIMEDAQRPLLEILELTERFHDNCRHLTNIKTISRCAETIHQLSKNGQEDSDY
ncbi:hypothetical protein KIN20_006947 [Parelaphostrongylus tenuis]|uniref:Uncharacterized protein n=1 Tax=Parelaphostrongylus tenuis TaxID=148309 RepID=A0AAD5MUT2_PARTN|nr:hypothetical protein KIN20_006947 [Parelaphostrongylus tenuis]